MAKENVTTKFRIDISDLEKNIDEANRQVKHYRAELANASAGMKKGEETADSLSRKIEAQSKIVETEQAKLEALKAELAKYESTLEKGQGIISDLTRKHEDAARAFGEDSEEAKELAKQLADAQAAQERNAAATDELRTRIINQDTAVKNAQGQVNQYSDALNNLQKEETETGNAAEKTAKGGLQAFAVALGNLASQAITGAVRGLGNLVKSVIETGKAFDTAMSRVKAISGRVAEEDIPAIIDKAEEMGLSFDEGADATATAMNIISAKAEQLGATTKFTATEAADAFSYMAMAGWKAKDMLNGIDGVMALAEASGAELAITSDIVTDSLSAFGEKAGEAGRLADIMAAAATNSNTNVEMMGETFKFAAPLAAALGYNMEDVAIATGIMANSGIKATMAGTSLRAIFTRLSTGTGEAGAALKGLGIDLEDGNGKMKSWLTVMDELRGSFGHLRMPINELNAELNKLDSALEDGEIDEEDFNEAQDKLIQKAYGAEGAMKAQYASMLAGKNGLSGFLAIVNSSEEDFDKLTKSIYNSEGAASEMASVMRDNLEGSLVLLSSAFDAFKKSIYESFSAPMNDLVKSITNNIMPALQGVVDGVPGSSDKLTDAISNFINNSIKDAAKILPDAVRIIGAVAGSIGEAAVRNMPEFIRNGVSLVEQIADGIIKSAPDAVKGIGKFIAESVTGAGDLLTHVADTVADTLPDFIDAIFMVAPKIVDSITRVAQKIAANLPTILEKLIDAIPAAVDGIAEFVGEQTPKLVAAAIQIVTGLVEALPSIVRHLVDAVPPIIASLTKILPSLFKDLTLAIVENAPALVRALIQLSIEVTKMLPDIIMPIIRMMPELTMAMAKAVVESAPEVVAAFGEMFADVAESLPALFGAVVTAFVGLRDDIAAALASAWTEVETAAQPASDFVVGVWQEAVNNTIAFFDSITGAASGAWDSIKTGASEAVDNVGKFFSGMWDKVKTTVSTVGSKIGDTLGSTIREGVNGVLEFVEDGLNNIPDAINGAIDLINKLPGVEISPMENIKLPRLEKGGIVGKSTLAQIGENGREAVIPLEKNQAGLREIAHLLAGEIQNLRAASAPQMTTNNITNQGTTINFTQNNTSPKALSEYDLWRQSQNLMSLVKAQGV